MVFFFYFYFCPQRPAAVVPKAANDLKTILPDSFSYVSNQINFASCTCSTLCTHTHTSARQMGLGLGLALICCLHIAHTQSVLGNFTITISTIMTKLRWLKGERLNEIYVFYTLWYLDVCPIICICTFLLWVFNILLLLIYMFVLSILPFYLCLRLLI